MGGEFSKQKLPKQMIIESEDSESDSGESSRSNKNSSAWPGRGSPKQAAATKMSRPAVKGNDALYRKINQQQQQKVVKIKLSPTCQDDGRRVKPSSGGKAASGKKDIDKNGAVILIPKDAKPKGKPSSKSAEPQQNYAMQYYHEYGPYGFASKQMMLKNGQPMLVGSAQEKMLKWEQKAISPYGQQYQYYEDQVKQTPATGQYEHIEAVKFQSTPCPIKVRQYMEHQMNMPASPPVYAPRSPLHPGTIESKHYFSHHFAPAYGMPPLPALPTQPLFSMGFSGGLSPERASFKAVSPRKDKDQTKKASPQSSSIAKKLDNVQRDLKELTELQKSNNRQIEQLNDHFRKAQAEFEATVKELNKQRTCCVTSQVGQSGSMLEQNLSQVSTQFKDIRSNIELLNRNNPKSPRAKQSAQSQAILIDQMNAQMEQFLNFLTQLKYSHNLDKLQQEDNSKRNSH